MSDEQPDTVGVEERPVVKKSKKQVAGDSKAAGAKKRSVSKPKSVKRVKKSSDDGAAGGDGEGVAAPSAKKAKVGKPKSAKAASANAGEGTKKKAAKRHKKTPYLGQSENLPRVVKPRKLEFRFAVIKRLIRSVMWETLGHEALFTSDAYHIIHHALEVYLGHRFAQARRIQMKLHPDRMTLRAGYLETSYDVEQRGLGNKEEPTLCLQPLQDKPPKGKKEKDGKDGEAAPKKKAPKKAAATGAVAPGKKAKKVIKKPVGKKKAASVAQDDAPVESGDAAGMS